MPSYSCKKCGKIFKQKSGYDDHIKKKFDCSQNTIITSVIEKKVDERIKEIVRTFNPYPELILDMDPDERKRQLQSYFEAIHNLLWNRAGLSPEKALEHLTFFFAYRLIEAQADSLGLPQDCRWSFLASHKNENDTYDTMKKGCMAFQKNKVTKSFFKKPEIDKADVIYEVIQQINRIPISALQESDTLGDIFEYMLGRGMSTMSDEGQYFTNRTICKLAFKLAFEIKRNLRRSDGTLATFADWFCGTGGFPAEYVKGVKEHLGPVDWKKESSKIYCQDMSLSSVTTTLLNLLILTGIPFTGETIRSANSFADPITKGSSAPFKGLQIDYCFMNPPYGGDKTKGKEYKFTYSKKINDDTGGASKKFFVNEDIQSIGVEDDDKVSAGVQLAMATLSKDGGVCCIVLPQGFFFGASKKCVELRKKIAEEYKIWYVVDIASGSFINTGTKTSMMVFQRGVGATEKVSFIGLDENLLIDATLEELRSKHYSLNYKQYLPQSAVEVEGYSVKKLSDIASDITFGFMVSSGDYGVDGVPVIKTKNIKDKKVDYPANDQKITTGLDDKYKVKKGDMLIVLGGSPGEHGIWNYSENAWLNQDCAKITIENEITKKFVFYMLGSSSVKSHIVSNTTKTTIGHISRGTVRDIPISLPSLERQQQIVEAIDGWTNLAQNEETSLKMLEKQMMFQVKEMGRGQARVKLGDVCDVKCGKPMPKTDIIEGEIPVIGGGISPMGFHNVSTHEEYTPMISQRGENSGYVSRYSTKTWITSNAVIPTLKNRLMLANNDVLYYVLKCNEEAFYNIVVKTAQPMLTVGNLLLVELQLPPLSEQQTLQSDFDEIRHKHAKIATYKAKAQEAIQRLIPGVSV
jgi:type I restriction enzyme, S subunit